MTDNSESKGNSNSKLKKATTDLALHNHVKSEINADHFPLLTQETWATLLVASQECFGDPVGWLKASDGTWVLKPSLIEMTLQFLDEVDFEKADLEDIANLTELETHTVCLISDAYWQDTERNMTLLEFFASVTGREKEKIFKGDLKIHQLQI